jgi:hypothetical protein
MVLSCLLVADSFGLQVKFKRNTMLKSHAFAIEKIYAEVKMCRMGGVVLLMMPVISGVLPLAFGVFVFLVMLIWPRNPESEFSSLV